MDNEQVAAILDEIAQLLELKGENPFKVRAYLNAARAIEALGEPIDKVLAEGRLGSIRGIGEGLQQKITELVQTGRLAYLEELRAQFPAGLLELMQIPGLGPRKVRVLYEHLGVQSIDELEKACREGRVATLPGFGEKSQQNILEAIRFVREHASRHLLSEALMVAEPILERLRAHPDVLRCSIAGSLRRWRETIGDIDFIASARDPQAVLDAFVKMDGVQSVLAHGATKASVVLTRGIQADLRVVSDQEYPFALCYFTGSKEHNIVMRQRAIQRGLRLNEYGLFRSKTDTRDPALRIGCQTEEEIYEVLGLQYIPPELREDMGEFEAAEKHQIPRLVEWTELRGSLHNHSNWSDGFQSLEEIVQMVSELRLEYWAIADHSKSSFQANGLTEERLRKQVQQIRDLNKRLEDADSPIRLLAGVEVDILKDRLDFGDDLLAQLDIVVASLHVAGRNEAENTKRLVMAAQNPFVHIIAHPTGRLLLAREAYPVDIKALIDACAETKTWIELNAHPQRLDLDWRWWLHAKAKGVKCVINCDAHRASEAQYLRIGAGIARKGWLTSADVINALPYCKLKEALVEKRRYFKAV